MRREASSLLRRTAPWAVVLLVLPATARASSPDPPPGAPVLGPDPAPVAATAPKPKPKAAAPTRLQASVAQPTVRAVVVRTAPAAATTSKPRVAAPAARRQQPARTIRTHRHKPTPSAVRFQLPPVLVPRLAPVELSDHPSAALAALALALAALTAGSGAGLVHSWSRR